MDELRGERTTEVLFYGIIVLLLASCLISGYVIQQGTERHARWLESFGEADPVADAQAQIAEEDYWLYRIDDAESSGYPGIDGPLAEQLVDEHGDKGIELFGKFVDLDAQRAQQANAAAKGYASSYNATIEAHLRALEAGATEPEADGRRR